MDHPIQRREEDVSVVGQLRRWLRNRFGGPSRGGADAQPEQVLTSTGRLRPNEDETSAEFSERVARIKADVLRRALAAIDLPEDVTEPAEDSTGEGPTPVEEEPEPVEAEPVPTP